MWLNCGKKKVLSAYASAKPTYTIMEQTVFTDIVVIGRLDHNDRQRLPVELGL
jgi:hypothetical protein